MAVAAWLVWRRGHAGARLPLILFAVQLTLNLAWSGLFFALRRPGLAFGEILLLWAAILATLLAFGRVSRLAAGLLAPYLAWVTFAAALNFAIWRLNP
jgi:tryptophan-rich sensory protein